MHVVGYRQLHSGPAADHADALHFQRRVGAELSADDAASLGVSSGDPVSITFAGQTIQRPVVINRGLRPGTVRLATRIPYVGPGSVAAVEEAAAGA
jgi:anaerobic selenocysteine-containing dehydrogenase